MSDNSDSDKTSSQQIIDNEINQLQISIDRCNTCSTNSSPTANSDVSDLTPCFSESNTPNSRNSDATVKSHISEDSRSSKTLASIQGSIKSSESSESITPGQEACIFMIKTMLTVFSESEEFYVNDNYEDQEDEITELEFFVFNNKDVENQGDLCLNFYFYFEPETEDIYIERAFTSTCGGVTGTEILNKMGMVFLLLKRKYEVTMKIRLDEAKLKFLGVEISLSWLYLFKSGESWYNSKGYKEHNYDNNKLLIEEFIRRKVVDVYNKEELGLISSISDQETIQVLFIKICDILKILKEEEADCCKYIELLNITIIKFMVFLKTQSSNDFMCTKFYELWYKPDKSIEDYLNEKIGLLPPLPVEEEEEEEGERERKGEEKGGRKRRKRQSIKNKKNRSIKKKRTKHRMKIVKKIKSKKAIKKRTKKHRK